MNRNLPLDEKAIEGKNSVFARNLTQYQVEMIKANWGILEGLSSEEKSLYFILNSWCADVGFLAYGMFEEHVSAIPEVGLDVKLIDFTKDL